MSEPSEFEARDWLESFCDDQADNVLDLLNEQINETIALTARAVKAEADLRVAVSALQQANGDGIDGNSWFVRDYCEVYTDDPATLRRLLTEEQT